MRMQIEQLEVRGIFHQAKVSGDHTNDVSARETENRLPGQELIRDSVPQTQTVTYTKPEQEQHTAFDDIKNSIVGKDAVRMKNEMVIGANTATPENVHALEEQGYSLPDTDIHSVVTETDKIQAQLAKAGKDTSYFTGDLSPEQIEAIAGSEALASQYQRALQQAQALAPLSEGAVKYMMDNQMEPTISNLYQAQYNGRSAYVAKPDDSLEQSLISEQIRNVILAAGMEPSAENLATGKWLAANELPVTPDNFTYAYTLQNMQLPPEQNAVITAMSQAVAEGRMPDDAYLAVNASPAARAAEALEVIEQTTDAELSYVLEQGQELTIANLREAHHLIEAGAVELPESDIYTDGDSAAFSEKGLMLLEARRILEETRLVMTTQANYALIRRGMEIDTKPLEQMVEELRTQEEDYYKNLLEADGSKADQTQILCFKETVEVADHLRYMPAYALGSAAFDGTIRSLHETASQLQTKMAAAGEAYETLMTAPRADLGDSIQKAFRNVEDILREIGMEPTEGNARAVRILSYNRLPINEQSVLEMKLADRQVQQAFESLKPAVVREMIRDGIDPLQLQMKELNEQAARISERIGGSDDLTKYSEYLWKLEQNHAISTEERDSYIGIYRLIHQVELGDGAAIGALVQQGAPITMRNLLSAVRSEKKSGMDYTIDDDFGGVEGHYEGRSITDQIQAAFQTECFREVQKVAQEPEQFSQLLSRENWRDMTPEQLLEEINRVPADETLKEAYVSEQLEELHAAASADAQVYEMLEAYHVPVTVNHVLAMQQMMATPNDALRRFFGLTDEVKAEDKKSELMGEISKIKDEILRKLGEQIQTPEELADAQRTLAEVAEHCGQTVMYEGMTRLNIRQLQMMTAQLHLGAAMTKEERYQIPILTSDGAMGVNVRIVRGSEKKGSVRITMESAAYGKVVAELQAGAKGIKGYFASDSRQGADRLQREQARAEELLGELTGETAENDIRVIYSAHLDIIKFELSGEKSVPEKDDALRELQTKELYGIAEKMIRFFSEGITKEG